MKCLILAAGYATRLYPLTENFPKPLLKVGEKTILDWLIDDIDTAGLVDGYIVNSNHKFASIFEEWATGRPCITVLPDLIGHQSLSSTMAPRRTKPASAPSATSSLRLNSWGWMTTCS